jgi:uncharacterized protein YutE (UPF0331/DUF86 family)
MHNRLQQLENNVAELKQLKSNYSLESIKSETALNWALRYGLLESIQIVIDISCHIAVHMNLGNAQTYAECIELIQKHEYINEDLGKKLKAMIGLRNILVHEYVAVETEKLYDMLNYLDDFSEFSELISDNPNLIRKDNL